jgi:BESS motif
VYLCICSTSSNYNGEVSDVESNGSETLNHEELENDEENETTSISVVDSPSSLSTLSGDVYKAPQQIRKRRAPKEAIDPVVASIISFLEKKQSIQDQRNPDECFLMSFVPVLKGLTSEKKSKAKVTLAEFMHEIEFGTILYDPPPLPSSSFSTTVIPQTHNWIPPCDQTQNDPAPMWSNWSYQNIGQQ